MPHPKKTLTPETDLEDLAAETAMGRTAFDLLIQGYAGLLGRMATTGQDGAVNSGTARSAQMADDQVLEDLLTTCQFS
ncbi:MAG: hypothetical protein ACI8TF_002562 [Paracoccaceae bacterium]|jgi:hypothetical protein